METEVPIKPQNQSESKLIAQLQLKQLQLNSLLQITEAINQNFSKSQILSIYEFIICNQLNVERLLLLSHDEVWEIAMHHGFEINDFDLSDILIADKDNPDIESAKAAFAAKGIIFNEVIRCTHKQQPLAYAFLGFNPALNGDFANNVFPYIQSITNIVMVALENKKLSKEATRQASMKKELALAAAMQSQLIPETLGNNLGIDISAYYRPMQEVGGDYYDFIQLNDKESLICMADVSGKGIAAALLMSNFQATLHALVKQKSDLVSLVHQLNESIINIAKGEKFITFFIAKINTAKKHIHYINAGHNPPILVQNNYIRHLEEGTIGLGMFEVLPFISEGFINLEDLEKAWLLCYTDGLIELEAPGGHAFTSELLDKITLECSKSNTAEEFKVELFDYLKTFMQQQYIGDDISLLVARLQL